MFYGKFFVLINFFVCIVVRFLIFDEILVLLSLDFRFFGMNVICFIFLGFLFVYGFSILVFFLVVFNLIMFCKKYF